MTVGCCSVEPAHVLFIISIFSVFFVSLPRLLSLSLARSAVLSLTLLYFSLTQAADDAFIFTHFLRYAGQ